MGAGKSSLSDLPSNPYLKRFVSSEVISSNDPFYNQFLSFRVKLPYSIADNRLLDESIEPLFASLLQSNQTSGNLASLLRVFLTRATELKASVQLENHIFTHQTFNALFILRVVLKWLLEFLPEHEVISQLQHGPKSSKEEEDFSNLFEKFLSCLVEIIVDVPLSELTYTLHDEVTLTLIVLSSSHIYSIGAAPRFLILRLLMTGRPAIHACLLTKILVSRVISKTPSEDASGGGLIFGLASGLWNALTFGLSDEDGHASQLPRLSLHSILLLLVLVHHWSAEKEGRNPFRTALLNAQNLNDNNECVATEAVASFKMDFAAAFSFFERFSSAEHVTLLLYILLHKNSHFRTYVLVRTDIESLVVPVLRTLYESTDANVSSHHVYMSLIVLLILSEDHSYNSAVHDIKLKDVSWFTEKPIHHISLGGLLILVVVRTITLNMTEMRDRYLHTNCLAALANMSSQFRDLHPYVCERIVSLFEILARRLWKVRQAVTRSALATLGPDDQFTSNKMNDVEVLEEVLRMVLEILNSTLTHQLAKNHNLIYCLMYKRHLFQQFGSISTFEDLSHNIEIVLSYLMDKLEARTTHPSVTDVQEVIEEGVLHLPREKLKKFSDLRFRYVEDTEPDEFFVPYVWTLVYRSSGLFWNSSKITLFESKSISSPDKL